MNRILFPLVVLAVACAGQAAVEAQPPGLRLVTQQVTIDKANDDRTLTVRYSGAAARTVELRINGKAVAVRYVNPQARSGETSFDLASVKLTEGENAVEVRVYDPSGKVLAFERTTLSVENLADRPVFIAKPAVGATVQGAIEVSVGFKVPMKNVYVSFFVDDDLKSIRNFSPYSYLWDTTKVENGWHEVQAWVVDEATQTYKTQRTRVFVNNPGGRTERTEAEAPAAPAAPSTAAPPAAPVAVGSLPTYSAPSGTKSVSLGAGTRMGLRTRQPSAPEPGLSAQPSKPAVPASPAEAEAPTKPRAAKEPAPIAEQPARAEAPPRAAKPEAPAPVKQAPPAVTAKPAEAPLAASANPAEAPRPPAAVNPGPAMANASVPRLAIAYGTRLADRPDLAVYVDGVRVASDVTVGVEDGVALAPFRFLYEHFGGKVGWEHATKTVFAEGPGGPIVIRIGSDAATVGEAKLALERAAKLVRNRTIVPVSFFSQALGLEIAYDPASGHVIVTTARKG